MENLQLIEWGRFENGHGQYLIGYCNSTRWFNNPYCGLFMQSDHKPTQTEVNAAWEKAEKFENDHNRSLSNIKKEYPEQIY